MSPVKGSLFVLRGRTAEKRHNSDVARKKSQRHMWRQLNRVLQEDHEAEKNERSLNFFFLRGLIDDARALEGSSINGITLFSSRFRRHPVMSSF